jgi:RHS repeat-associated protein
MGAKGDDGFGAPLAYDEFGVPLVSAQNVDNPFGFTGYQTENITGLYYAQARYYDPANTRMLSQDIVKGNILKPHGLNPYSYALNNPLKYIDPTGMTEEVIGSLLTDSGKEVVRTGVRIGESAINTALNFVTFGHLNTAKVGALTLMMDKEPFGEGYTYHAKVDCWQRFFGFNDFYDEVFDTGTYMNRAKFEFETPDGREYMIWAWKGDYINLGAGAELGIYTRGTDLFSILTSPLSHATGYYPDHWVSALDHKMPMSVTLEMNNKKIIDYANAKHWWITGFNPEYKYLDAKDVRDMTATFTINFENRKDLYYAFINSDDYKRNKEKWSADKQNGYLMTFSFSNLSESG